MWWLLVAACAPKVVPDAVPRAEKVVVVEALERPTNLSFEDGYDGWALGGEVDGDRDGFVTADGDWSVRIHATGEAWGSWTQCVQASAWAGGVVTMTGRLRTAGATGEGAGLWLRIDGAEGSGRRTLAFDNSATHRLVGDTGWTDASVELPVDEAATGACYGLLLVGEGTAWADAIAFERRDAPPPEPAATTPRDQGIANLALLGRIWGAARYFVPPVDGVSIDWDAILLDAIPLVEAADSDEALADALRRAFEPAHGAVRIAGGTFEPPVLEPGEVLVVPGEAYDIADAAATVVDLRGGVAFPADLQAAMAAGPGELPRQRWASYQGFYPLDPSLEMPMELVEARVGRIERDDGPAWPDTTLLVDPTTRADAVGAAITLQRQGAWVRGEPTIGSPEPGWRVDLPGGGAAEVLVRPYAQALVPDESLVPASVSTPASLRTKRIANVLLVWATFEWFYPYWEDAGPVDWDAQRDRAVRDAATAETPLDMGRVLRAMLAPTHDGHGWLRLPGLPEPGLAAPIAFTWSGEEPVVVEAWGSAADAGVAAGDVLVTVDGASIADRLDALDVYAPSASAWGRRWNFARFLTAGDDGDVVLGLRGLDGVAREVSVARDTQTAALYRRDLPQGEGVRDLGDGVLYVDLDVGDAEGTRTAEIVAGLDRAGKAKGLVLDLRGYPDWRGAIEVVARLAVRPARTQLLDTPRIEGPGPPVGWHRGQWQAPPMEPHIGVPTAVLIDGRALSRAEHVAAMFGDNDLATLVGTPTAGTNGEVVFLEGFSGVSVAFTGMRVRNADGSRHLGVGVLPDVVVERTPQGVAEGRDEQLERAIEIVRGQ